MKRCSDPKCELVFPQLVRGLRKLLEKCFGGDVKYNPSAATRPRVAVPGETNLPTQVTTDTTVA